MPKEGTRSKGFCFVEYANPESANMAITTMPGFNLKGRYVICLRVSFFDQTMMYRFYCRLFFSFCILHEYISMLLSFSFLCYVFFCYVVGFFLFCFFSFVSLFFTVFCFFAFPISLSLVERPDCRISSAAAVVNGPSF